MIESIIIFLETNDIGFPEYKAIRSKIEQQNTEMLSLIAITFFFCLSILHLLSLGIDTFRIDRALYFIGIIGVFILRILSEESIEHNKINPKLVGYAKILFFAYGIADGIILHPTASSLVFILMLVSIPILFIDRPIIIITETIMAAASFIFACLIFKTGDALASDLVCTALCGFIAIIVGCHLSHYRCKALDGEQKVYTLLFGVGNNINPVPKAKDDATCKSLSKLSPLSFEGKLSCICLDTNDICLLDPSQDPKPRTEMLSSVSSIVHELFDDDHIFSHTSKKFIIFATNVTQDKLDVLTNKLNHRIQKAGYSARVNSLKGNPGQSIKTLVDETIFNNDYRFNSIF